MTRELDATTLMSCLEVRIKLKKGKEEESEMEGGFVVTVVRLAARYA